MLLLMAFFCFSPQRIRKSQTASKSAKQGSHLNLDRMLCASAPSMQQKYLMLAPKSYKDISPLTTQQTKQSTKSSLSNTLIQFSRPSLISFYCLALIYFSMFNLTSINRVILSRILCYKINFYMLSAVFFICISLASTSTAIVFMPNSVRSKLEDQISPTFEDSLIFINGITLTSQMLLHVFVCVIIKCDVRSVSLSRIFQFYFWEKNLLKQRKASWPTKSLKRLYFFIKSPIDPNLTLLMCSYQKALMQYRT